MERLLLRRMGSCGVTSMDELKKAGNVLTNQYNNIQEDEILSKALSMFEKSSDVFIVLDKNQKYSGILVARDIIKSATNIESTKVRTLKRHAPKISKETSVAEVARLMLGDNVMALPVFEDNELVGVVSDKSLLESLSKQIKKKEVKELMSTDLITASPDEKISSVLADFRDHQISRMPVLSKGRVIGIVTIHDLLDNIYHPKKRQNLGYIMDEKLRLLDLPIKSIMKKQLVKAKENNSIQSIVKRMTNNNVGSVIILDNKTRLSGIITKKDLLEPLAELAKGLVPPVIYVNSKTENIDREKIGDIITEYTEKHPDLLKRSVFSVYVNTHKETFRNDNLIYTRVRVHTPSGRFAAYAEGWGEENAVKNALLKIERQIERKLDLSNMFNKKKFLKYVEIESLA